MIEFVLELQEGCWMTTGDGDPPRTLVFDHAVRYKCVTGAMRDLEKARSYRRITNPRIYPAEMYERIQALIAENDTLRERLQAEQIFMTEMRDEIMISLPNARYSHERLTERIESRLPTFFRRSSVVSRSLGDGAAPNAVAGGESI